MSPAASTNLLGESGGINGQVHSLSQSVSNNLPERPDQPECRYFMNTGSCKYGSDCKYHHPREKTAQFATSSLGPLGLPLRPVSFSTFHLLKSSRYVLGITPSVTN